jgi:hypothetical protein
MNGPLKVRWGLCIWLAAGLLSGCNASSDTVPVTGKVTKGGQPIAGADITFIPTAKEGKPAAGTTDASGVYTLTTSVHGDGALPGSYKVTITKFAGSGGAGIEAGREATPQDLDAIYRNMEKQGKNVMTPGKNLATKAQNEIAEKFANADSSGLSAEVKAGAANSFDFDVTAR